MIFFVLVGKKWWQFFLWFFFIQLRFSWVDPLLCLVKIRFVFSAWALQQFNKSCRRVVIVSAWTIKKAFSHKDRHKNLCRKTAKNCFQIWPTSLQLWNTLGFCLPVLKQQLISRPLQPGFVLVFTSQCEVRSWWMEAWMSSCSFDYSCSAAGATVPPVENISFDGTSSTLF